MKNIYSSITERAKEYATQMMGIGQYSEKWNLPDKSMWSNLDQAYRLGALYGKSLNNGEEIKPFESVTTAEKAVVILKQYSDNNGFPSRSTSDISPLEDWLLSELIKANFSKQKESVVDAVYEGAEQWKIEYDNCRELLENICDLQKAELEKPKKLMPGVSLQLVKAYDEAKKFLENYQHQ